MANALDTTTHPTGITSGPHAFQSSVKATAITTPLFSTAGAGRLLVLLYSGPSSGTGAASISSVTPSGGSFSTAFTKLVAQNGPSGTNGCSEIWWAVNSATLSNITVAVALNPAVTGNYGSLSIVAFTGAALTAPTNTLLAELDTNTGIIAATITGTVAGSWVLGTAQDSNTGAARTYLSNTTEIIGGTDNGGDYDTNFYYNGAASPGGSLTLGTSTPTDARYTIALVEIAAASGGSSFTSTQTETASPTASFTLGSIAGAASEAESASPTAAFAAATAGAATQAETTTPDGIFAGAMAIPATQAESAQALDAYAFQLIIAAAQAETTTPSVALSVAQAMGATFIASTSPSVSFDDGASPPRRIAGFPFWPWWYRLQPFNRKRIM